MEQDQGPSHEIKIFDGVRIDERYSSTYLDEYYDSSNYLESKNLEETVYHTFKARWPDEEIHSIDYKFSKNKEFQSEVLHYIFDKLKTNTWPKTEIFICVAGFMDVSVEKLLSICGTKMESIIANELDVKYGILRKRRTKKLF